MAKCEELNADMIRRLIDRAIEGMSCAYTPYSGFRVGAALLTESGEIYTGCNIENAAYTPTNCAERTAFFKAVSEGERHFTAICIVGGKVMMEFCEPEQFKIILAISREEYRIYTLKELLPEGFGPARIAR